MMIGEDIKILHEGPSLISFRGAFDAAGSRLPSNPPRLFSGLVAQLVEQCPLRHWSRVRVPANPPLYQLEPVLKLRGVLFSQKWPDGEARRRRVSVADLRLRSNKARWPFPRKISGRRVFCPWPALAGPLSRRVGITPLPL